MAWMPIKRILRSAMREKGLQEAVDAAAIVEAANDFIRRRFSDPHLIAVRAISFRDGFLSVACRGPAFADEVRLSESELSSAIRDKHPSVRFSGLRFASFGDILNS